MSARRTEYRYQVGGWPVSRLLMAAAFILFILATITTAGIISAPGWLLGGGLAALALAFVIP